MSTHALIWVIEFVTVFAVAGLAVTAWLLAWRARLEVKLAQRRAALLEEWAGASNEVVGELADMAFDANLRHLARRR